MREAIRRRLAHTEDPYPDLILLDGGKAHVSVVREVLREQNVDIPVFGMVKDAFHKTRALTDDVGEISIAKENAVFVYIYKLQEEVHRYTVGRMHNAKRKSVKKSSLTNIDGIGDIKARNIMAHFKSIAALKTADREELSAVKGLNKADVDNIYMYFHGDENTED